MTKYIRQLRAPLALCAALAVGACTVKDSKSDSSLAADTALNRDLALAGKDTTVQPQLRDIPATPSSTPAPAATPAPRGTTPAPRPSTSGRTTTTTRTTTPARTPSTTTTTSGNTVTRNTTGSAAGGAVGTIASGTSLSLRSNARVCTNTYQPGQTFTATTTSAVTGSNGATIPAGATVKLEVTSLKRSENATDKIVMEFAVRSVSFGGRTYNVEASVANADVERVRNQPKDKDVQKVVGGAVLGAIAGQILGKSTKSTVVGAAAGAAAGAGVAAGTANYEGCLPDGGSVTVTLNAPLQVKIT
ncbi:MAG TPA: hypothetical protein VFI52_11150 [Gemmatimonadaceae bacterium]|nr:hypothetical protein [Gemmatimonadaceae bacterium]